MKRREFFRKGLHSTATVAGAVAVMGLLPAAAAEEPDASAPQPSPCQSAVPIEGGVLEAAAVPRERLRLTEEDARIYFYGLACGALDINRAAILRHDRPWDYAAEVVDNQFVCERVGMADRFENIVWRDKFAYARIIILNVNDPTDRADILMNVSLASKVKAITEFFQRHRVMRRMQQALSDHVMAFEAGRTDWMA